jgi:RNA polymerase sigma factor (sigma-70 family)
VAERTAPVDDSFDAAFERLALLAYRVARRVLVNGGDAENVAAETLARAQVRWRSVHDHAEAWVVTVATRLAVREARRGQRAQPNLQSVAIGDDSEGAIARVDLARALDRLSRRQREAIALRYIGDMTDADAADAMGCSVPSFRTHCARALTALRAELGGIPSWTQDQQEGRRS